MKKTSTSSEPCCSGMLGGLFTGALLLVGLGAALWYLFGREETGEHDPQREIDRRISELEDSLSHLQDSFSSTVRR
jgi:hypothetical protein